MKFFPNYDIISVSIRGNVLNFYIIYILLLFTHNNSCFIILKKELEKNISITKFFSELRYNIRFGSWQRFELLYGLNNDMKKFWGL